jgi:hypothetical protein
VLEYHNQPVSTSNPVLLSPGAPVELQWVNVDAGGDAVPVTLPGGASATITAPAGMDFATSVGGTATKTASLTIPGGATSANVWAVSATAATLSQDLPVNDYAHLVISSGAQSNVSGHYTLYSVKVENAQGAVITGGVDASGTLTVADNQPAVANWNDSNALYYWYGSSLATGEGGGSPHSSSQSDASASQASPMHFDLPFSGGSAEFMVQSYASGSPVTITVGSAGMTSVSASYQLGTAGYAVVETDGVSMGDAYAAGYSGQVSVAPGETFTVYAQLTDVNQQPLHESGQPIWFAVSQNANAGGTVATISGYASHNGAPSTYVEATTNSQGIASATIAVPVQAPTADGAYNSLGSGAYDRFVVEAYGSQQHGSPTYWYGTANSSIRAGSSPVYDVVPSAQLGVSLAPSDVAVAYPAGTIQHDLNFATGPSDSLLVYKENPTTLTVRNAAGKSAYATGSYFWNDPTQPSFNTGYGSYGFGAGARPRAGAR